MQIKLRGGAVILDVSWKQKNVNTVWKAPARANS